MKLRAEELVGRMSQLVEPAEDLHFIGVQDEPLFENNWTNYNTATHASAAFYKQMNRVEISGFIAGGTTTSGTTIFTLPIGYRPDFMTVFPSVNVGWNPITLEVNMDGTVKIYNCTSNTWVCLDGISFRIN